jgi:hypothetical protein
MTSTRVKRPAKTDKSVESKMTLKAPKLHSAQYIGDGAEAHLGGVYVPKAMLQELTGDTSIPPTLTITVSVP